jgi:murein DD-endopeptidase MepM/ murein hydrolase activator NlpD
MSVRRLVVAGLSVSLLGVAACLEAPARPKPAAVDIHLPRDTRVIEARVPRNATLASILRAHEIGDAMVTGIVGAAHRAFDVRKLRAEQPYRLEMSASGAVREFVYRIDADRFLRVSPASAATLATPDFDAEVVPYRKDIALVSLRGTIDREHPSLVAAINASGEDVTLAIALADVFGGDIDFNNDLQPGDRFELVFEKRLSEGQLAGYGPILAAEFHNDGRFLTAIRFQVPGHPAGYYDGQGRSLKRFFLRSPLKFEPRISSGFSMRRLHPVLGTFRAHPAVDYVAPTGAPVVAVAGGTVTRAGWSGGGGNSVVVRHDNGYESSYLHLSAFGPGIRAGAHVQQGQLVGKVGCTGLCTGSHLDYRLKRHGAWVNPLAEHKKMPPGEPVPAAALAAFEAARDAALARFVSARPPAAPPTVATAGTATGGAASR